MIDCIYFNDTIRCYRNGVVERLFRNCYWKIVENTGNCKGYDTIGINGKMISRHRLMAYCFLGLNDIVGDKIGTDLIDHIDNNPLNNSVANLRIATPSINQQNRKHKGYYFNKKRGLFKSQIWLDGKNIYLGYYATEEEARQAYLSGKEKYHIA